MYIVRKSILHSLVVKHRCGINKKSYFFSPSTDIVSKYTIFIVVKLSSIYLPFVLSLNINKFVFEYVCPLIVMEIIAKITD